MATTMEPKTEPRSRIAASAPSSETPAKATPKRSRRTVFLIMGVVLLGLLVFGARKWWFGRNHVSTDNAQVDGHIVPILPKVGGYGAEEIGRASCRERVEISVVAGSLKKKKKKERG